MVTKNGKKTVDVVYLITSDRHADPATRAAWVRSRREIENKLHWVRDATYQEDKSLVRTGNAPGVMATLRSLAVSLLRLHNTATLPPPTATTPATRNGRLSDFTAFPWCARSAMLTCFCPYAVDAAVFSYYGSTGTRGDRETIRPFGSSWSPSSSNTTPLHSRLQPWSG
jgi:hypothetical protein